MLRVLQCDQISISPGGLLTLEPPYTSLFYDNLVWYIDEMAIMSLCDTTNPECGNPAYGFKTRLKAHMGARADMKGLDLEDFIKPLTAT